jgi:hypothetical protein
MLEEELEQTPLVQLLELPVPDMINQEAVDQ